MKNPSSQWTERERLDVIEATALLAWEERSKGLESLLDKVTRVRFLASMSAIFLEVNREAFLRGLTIDDPEPGATP